MNQSHLGIPVNVYRCAGIDCTNGGVTSRFDRLILLGDDLPQVLEPTENCPGLVLKNRGNYIFAVPAINPTGKPWMMGGNFIYTPDSRLLRICQYPIPVHDRQE